MFAGGDKTADVYATWVGPWGGQKRLDVRREEA